MAAGFPFASALVISRRLLSEHLPVRARVLLRGCRSLGLYMAGTVPLTLSSLESIKQEVPRLYLFAF